MRLRENYSSSCKSFNGVGIRDELKASRYRHRRGEVALPFSVIKSTHDTDDMAQKSFQQLSFH